MLKLRALVVDDSRVMRNMVMENLKRTGLAEFIFTEASDGKDALRKFSPKKFDIAFVDIHMPNMDGIEFVNRAREKGGTESIPFIMITSEKTMGKMTDASDAGANSYICKPFTTLELRKKLVPIVDKLNKGSKAAGFFHNLG